MESLNRAKIMVDINYTHTYNLLKLFSENVYTSCKIDDKHRAISKLLQLLFQLDNDVEMLDNSTGDLCPEYPPILIIPNVQVESKSMVQTVASSKDEKVKLVRIQDDESVVPEMIQTASHTHHLPHSVEQIIQELRVKVYGEAWMTDKENFKSVVNDAIYGRSRKRFAVPVILYKNKVVTRSSTVPMQAEVLMRYGIDVSSEWLGSWSYLSLAGIMPTANLSNMKDTVKEGYELLTKSIEADQKLLGICNVDCIYDLMVEQGKVKYNMKVSSSEKDGTDYKKFKLFIIPYPGCEFFKSFKDEYYNSEGLLFDWKNPEVNSLLSLPSERAMDIQTIWDYQKWPLHHLTRVYLMVMLQQLKYGNTGILVHCISGWDRTPLFICLLRLSLWADGEIHQSLNPMQMLYFTLAYDWLLFGHNLKNRQEKGEQVLVFCFSFLKYIKGNNFSVVNDEIFGKLSDWNPAVATQSTVDSLEASLGVITLGHYSSPDTSSGSSNDVSPARREDIYAIGAVDIPGATPKREGSGGRPLLIGRSSPLDYGCEDENQLDAEAMDRRRGRHRHARITQIRELFFILAEDTGLMSPKTPQTYDYFTRGAAAFRNLVGI